MGKPHGDFGDLSRYDVSYSTDLGPRIELSCQDCGSVIATWPQVTKMDGTVLMEVGLTELTRAASAHETAEEEDPAMDLGQGMEEPEPRDDDVVLAILVRRDGAFTYSGSLDDVRPKVVPKVLRQMAEQIEAQQDHG